MKKDKKGNSELTTSQTKVEIKNKISVLDADFFRLNLQKFLGQLSDVSLLRKNRVEVARLQTLLMRDGI
jgi:ribosomal protein L29